MRYTTLVDDLLVNNTALSSITGLVVSEYPFFGPGTRRGDNDTIPGRRGTIGSYKPLDAYSFSIPVGVMGCSATGYFPSSLEGQRVNMLQNIGYAANILSGNGGKVTLTRKIQTSETGAYSLQDASGEFVQGTAFDMFVPEAAKTELEFINHDGCWYDQAYTTVNPGTLTILGNYETRRILISLPSAGILYNSSMGVSVTVTEACDLDCENFTASAGLATLTHLGDYSFFVLSPGQQVVTWSGTGTPDIQYKAAWV